MPATIETILNEVKAMEAIKARHVATARAMRASGIQELARTQQGKANALTRKINDLLIRIPATEAETLQALKREEINAALHLGGLLAGKPERD